MRMRIAKSYDKEFKMNAVKLAEEIGTAKAIRELGIPEGTMYTWLKKYKSGELDLGIGTQNPQAAITLAEEVQQLKQELRRKEMENQEKARIIEILKEASIFFAQSQKK